MPLVECIKKEAVLIPKMSYNLAAVHAFLQPAATLQMSACVHER